jgi:hypothetical protein
MDLMHLDPSTIGTTGVGLGAILVGLAYRLLRHLVTLAQRAEELAIEGKKTLEAAREYFEGASGHAQRTEDLLEDIRDGLAAPRYVQPVRAPVPPPPEYGLRGDGTVSAGGF